MSLYQYTVSRECSIGLLCVLMLMNFFCQSPKPPPSILQYVVHSQNEDFIKLQYADSLALFISKNKALEAFERLKPAYKEEPEAHRYINSRITSLKAELEMLDSSVLNSNIEERPNDIFDAIAAYDKKYYLQPNTIIIESLKELTNHPSGFYPKVLALNRIGQFYKNVCFDLDSSRQYFMAARDSLEKIGLITLEHIFCYENLLTLSIYKRNNLDAIMYGNDLCNFKRYSWKPDSVQMARAYINTAFVLFREDDNIGSKVDNNLARNLIDSIKNIEEFQLMLRNELIFSWKFDSEDNFTNNKSALVRSIKTSNKDYVNVNRLCANYLKNKKKYTEAIPYLFEAMNYESNQLRNNFAAYSNVCDLFSDCYIALGLFDEALIYIAKNEYLDELTEEKSIFDYLKNHPESPFSFTTAISCANLFYEKFLLTQNLKDLKLANKYIELVNEIMYSQFNISEEYAILQFYLETGNSYFQLAMKIYHHLFKFTTDSLYLEKFINFSENSKNSLMKRDIYIYNQRTELSAELIENEKQIRSLRQKEIIKGFRNNFSFNEIQRQYNRINAEIESRYIIYSSNKLISINETLQEIKAKIDAHTSIVNTAHFDGQIYLNLINKYKVEIIKLNSDSLEVATINTLDSIINSNSGRDTTKFNQLYSQMKKSLFPPNIEKELKENLIIIPDGLFHRLPMQSLFGKDRNITYSPSIKTIRTDENSIKRKEKLAAFAFSSKNTVIADKRFYLKELPGSKKEVEKLESIYPKSQAYYGQSATKENFIKTYKDTTIEYIHLALHGFSNSKLKDDVKLYFRTPDGGIDSLYGFELLGIKSRVIKIVLSACQSTAGKYVEGEGNYSLIRYFLINGAKEVHASYFNLDDQYFESYNLYKYKIN